MRTISSFDPRPLPHLVATEQKIATERRQALWQWEANYRRPLNFSVIVTDVSATNPETLSTCEAFLPALETRQDADGKTRQRPESGELCRSLFAPMGLDGLRRRVCLQWSF
jgi:hypothetical protein